VTGQRRPQKITVPFDVPTAAMKGMLSLGEGYTVYVLLKSV
jgi:hypothetical protein